MKLQYTGYNTNVPFPFLEYYVRCDPQEVMVYEISGVMRTKVKIRAFLSRRAWQYYMWIDSFSDSLQGRVDGDRFLQKINWPTVDAVLLTYIGWLQQQRRDRLSRLRSRDNTLPTDVNPPNVASETHNTEGSEGDNP
jgi:hypothetical protein